MVDGRPFSEMHAQVGEREAFDSRVVIAKKTKLTGLGSNYSKSWGWV